MLTGPLEPERVNATFHAACFAGTEDLLILLKLMDCSYLCLIVQRFACRPTKPANSGTWLVTILNMGEAHKVLLQNGTLFPHSKFPSSYLMLATLILEYFCIYNQETFKECYSDWLIG